MYGSGYKESTSRGQPSSHSSRTNSHPQRSSRHHDDRQHHHGSSSSGGGSSSRHHPHPSSQSQPRIIRQPNPPPFSFLFVVCPLTTSELYSHECDRDRWGIMEEPKLAAHLEEQADIHLPVFRFQNDQVTEATDHFWVRSNGPHSFGQVVGMSPTGEGYAMVEFETYTVLRGCRFRPIMFMADDATVVDVDNSDQQRMYHALHFEANPISNRLGVSMARGRSGYLFAAGHSASWVGRLVPDSYENPTANPNHIVQSRGLMGLLPVILGVMALSQRRGQELEAFRRGMWRHREWHGPRWSFQYPEPGPHDPPRAVMVHVCCDSLYNPQMSTHDLLTDFADTQVLVRG